MRSLLGSCGENDGDVFHSPHELILFMSIDSYPDQDIPGEQRIGTGK